MGGFLPGMVLFPGVEDDEIVQCTHGFGLEEGWEEGVAPGD